MGKTLCEVLSDHINKVQRGLITRTSICQAGSMSPFSTVDSSSPVIFSSCWSWILAYALKIKAQHMFLCRLDYTSCPDNQWQTFRHIVPEKKTDCGKTQFGCEMLKKWDIVNPGVRLSHQQTALFMFRLICSVQCSALSYLTLMYVQVCVMCILVWIILVRIYPTASAKGLPNHPVNKRFSSPGADEHRSFLGRLLKATWTTHTSKGLLSLSLPCQSWVNWAPPRGHLLKCNFTMTTARVKTSLSFAGAYSAVLTLGRWRLTVI